MFRFEQDLDILRTNRTIQHIRRLVHIIYRSKLQWKNLPFIINVEVDLSIKGKSKSSVIDCSFINLTHPTYLKLLNSYSYQQTYMCRKPSEPSVTCCPTLFTSATRKKLSPPSLKLLDLNEINIFICLMIITITLEPTNDEAVHILSPWCPG